MSTAGHSDEDDQQAVGDKNLELRNEVRAREIAYESKIKQRNKTKTGLFLKQLREKKEEKIVKKKKRSMNK